VLHSLAAAAEMGFSGLTIGGLLGDSVPGVTGLRTYPRLRAAGHSRSGFSANRDRARRRVPAAMVELRNRVETFPFLPVVA
jgi:hypothetical protein